jgi:hypothetical protein
MKKKFYTILWLLLSVSLYSCKDEDTVEEEYPTEREFSTMFRQDRNTGKGDSDPYRCQAVNKNDIQLYWYGVKGCAGYRLKMGLQTAMGAPEDWDDPLKVLKDTIVGPEVLDLLVEDLQYSTIYKFAIQVLSTKGEEYNSKWHGHGDGRHWADYLAIETDVRYPIPEVVVVGDITKNSFRINIDRNYATSGDNATNNFTEHFEVDDDGNYVMQTLTIEPSNTNPNAKGARTIQLTQADFDRGYIDVDGFDENCVYIVNVLNNKIVRYWDRLYNTCVIRMAGEPGEPILIEHYCDPNDTIAEAAQYNASRLDTILINYNSDASLAEGTIFELEGGKTYYMINTISLCKGLTLRTKAGTGRARVLMGITKVNNAVQSMNFMFGRNPEPGELGGINIQSLIFEGIDFDCPDAKFYDGTSGTGNYFINMYPGGMAVSISSFELRDCTFQRMVRGFVRIQGPNRKTIENFLVEDCLFYNCGAYDANGAGYAWIAGDGAHTKSNIFQNMVFRNSTFYDSPRTAMFFDNNKDLAWADNINWNITLENCTFVNYSTRTSGRPIFSLRYVPGGSTIIARKNLFILTKQNSDTRPLNFAGMDIRTIRGSQIIQYDIQQNYSTNTNLTAGQIFSSAAFSATSNSAGVNGGAANLLGREELVVHLGTEGISPTELMRNPNPPNLSPQANMHIVDNLDGLYFNNTDKVRNHEIYKLGIGDPRWRESVTP